MLLCCATRRFAACQLNAADERTLPLPLPPCEITYAAGGAQLFRQMPRETMRRREGRRGRSLSRRRCRNGSVNGELKIHLLINFSQCQSVSRKKQQQHEEAATARRKGQLRQADRCIPLQVLIPSGYSTNCYYYIIILCK